MSERVLFEFRAEEGEDRYAFYINRDKEAFSTWCPFISGRFFPFFKDDVKKYLKRYRRSSKRWMRRRLDFYERMYKDLYGPMEEGQE